MCDDETPYLELGEHLRALWISHYRAMLKRQTGKPSAYSSSVRYDGGVSNGTKHEGIWSGLAAKIREANLDPELLFQVLFAEVKNKPYPQYLLSPSNIQRYKEALVDNVDQMEQDLLLQKRAFQLAVAKEEVFYGRSQSTVERVLDDMTIAISDLFRYCVASQSNMERIKRRFHKRAIAEYSKNSLAYSRIWGDCIPPELHSLSGRDK